MNYQVEMFFISVVVVLLFVSGYIVVFIQGRRYERIGWLRWILSQIENIRVEIEKEDMKQVLKEGIE